MTPEDLAKLITDPIRNNPDPLVEKEAALAGKTIDDIATEIQFFLEFMLLPE